MRQLGLILIACLSAAPVFALPVTCPDIEDLSLADGEYAWESKHSLWEGFFAHPMTGIGKSSNIESFIEARWIQLNKSNNPQGIVECDYSGNVSGEIIRFVSNQSGPTPQDVAWSCSYHPDFPSPQCHCSASPAQCIFEKS